MTPKETLREQDKLKKKVDAKKHKKNNVRQSEQ